MFQPNSYYATAILADGTAMSLHTNSANCTGNSGTSKMLEKTCGTIAIDLNGPKPPNQFGIDTFYFRISKYGPIPRGMPDDTANPLDTTCKNKTQIGHGCAAWVINKENMDYLHKDIAW